MWKKEIVQNLFGAGEIRKEMWKDVGAFEERDESGSRTSREEEEMKLELRQKKNNREKKNEMK